jgi:hypothetical protein
MATSTPNYNLGKPEPTDPFGYNSFLPLFNDNMDKIDGMGGNQNIAENYDDTLTYSVGDYVIYNGLLYKCDTAVSTAETFDPTKWTHVVVTDEMGSGGGSGSLDAVETNSDAYVQLPQADKDDPTKIYFLNDTQSSEVETPVDFSSFVNATEPSTTISVVNDELVYTWNGGSSIRQISYYPTVIPASVKKIKFKLTTGSSSYYNNVSADARWQICIGVKASYSTEVIFPTDSNWLVNAIYNTVNDVIEGELDLSSITSDCYLMICAHGWNLTWNEISTVADSEATGHTEIRYKDVPYADADTSYFTVVNGAVNIVFDDGN